MLQCVEFWVYLSATALVRAGDALHCKMVCSRVQHIVFYATLKSRSAVPLRAALYMDHSITVSMSSILHRQLFCQQERSVVQLQD